MAKILLAEEWAEPSPLAIQLQYDLSEDYLIVSDPTVQGRKLDAVVVGPQGLFVLHHVAVGKEPPAEKDDEGRLAEVEERVDQATRAVEGFLRDEFPALSLRVYHLLVLSGTQEERVRPPSADVAVATVGTAAQEIAAVDPPATGPALDDGERRELAVGLRDRRLTVSQRASQPFVFRSGDVFGSGTEVWTIREAVRHMAAHPESGIYHLRNGTLAAWLHSEGAEHQARVARDVMRSQTDRRAALETFLVSTGLVEPPRLRVWPQEVDLGYLTAGDAVSRRLRVGKASGRGYLFGTLEPSVPWLSVYPRHFNSESEETVVSVRAETESLPIGQRLSQASIHVHSNASPEPLEVPVHLRVVGMPSLFNRRFLRPAAGFVVAALMGAGLGGLLAMDGAPGAGLLAGLRWLPLSPAAVWALAIGLVWGAFGALRGATQPEAWPTSYAMGRWLFRLLVWSVALILVGAACLWGWNQLLPRGTALPGMAFRALLVVPMVLAILPATVGEIRSGPEMRDTSLRAIRWSYLRPFLLPLAAIVLALAAAVGAPQLRPALQRLDVPEVAASVGEWTEARLVQVGERLDDVLDQLYFRYYGHDAPPQGGNDGS
ncbi:MAG: hypothetical protein ACOC7N_05195 [Chloroflexota bacterium]